MFGAWQAGAWRALADRFQPDLVVGASVGCLNGYAIAGGASPEELAHMWLDPKACRLRDLPRNVRQLVTHYTPRVEFALVVTDLTRLKPKIFAGELTWKHLAASCAIPGVMPQYRIGGRWYTDGGLLNPLPVWAAVELGASQIVALDALPQAPSPMLARAAKIFRRVAGHHPPLPEGIALTVVSSGGPLGSTTDVLRWKRANAERWIEKGYTAAKNISIRE